MPRNIDGTERRGERSAGRNLGLSDQYVTHVVCVAQLIANRDVAVHVVLHFGGSDVVVSAKIIAVLETVIVVARYRYWPVEQPWNAVIRIVVGVLVKVTEGPARRGSESKRERWCDAEAAILGHIP